MFGEAAAFALMAAAPAAQAEPSCTHAETTRGGLHYEVFLIFFDTGSAAIRSDMAAILDNAVETYRPLAHCLVTVAAHADKAGPASYNRLLSARRADAVVAYLRARGVRARTRIEPFGATRPLVETADGVAEPQNRRAEILVGLIQPRD